MLMCQYANWLRYYNEFPYMSLYHYTNTMCQVSIARYYTK